MPSLGSKGKGKVKDGRQSRSRNTTPISVVSAPLEGPTTTTAYLEIPLGSMMIPSNILYEDILERHGSGGGIPDPKHLEALKNDLTALSQLAAARESACDGGMRDLSSRRKQRIEKEREMEQESREAKEKAHLKRAAEDDDSERASKAKQKKRREQIKLKEERPLTHGAHGVARQDGVDPSQGSCGVLSLSITGLRACQTYFFFLGQLYDVFKQAKTPIIDN
jgi:transcriptional adapter 3